MKLPQEHKQLSSDDMCARLEKSYDENKSYDGRPFYDINYNIRAGRTRPAKHSTTPTAAAIILRR